MTSSSRVAGGGRSMGSWLSGLTLVLDDLAGSALEFFAEHIQRIEIDANETAVPKAIGERRIDAKELLKSIRGLDAPFFSDVSDVSGDHVLHDYSILPEKGMLKEKSSGSAIIPFTGSSRSASICLLEFPTGGRMKDFLDLALRFRETPIVDDDFPEMLHRFDSRLRYLYLNLPPIVCLCGSTRFYEEFQRANFRETMAGKIVLTVGFYPHAECSKEAHGEDVGITAADKRNLDDLHKRKIDLADEVLVLNVGGYIGNSTRSEIEYANGQGKTIRYLEPIADAA